MEYILSCEICQYDYDENVRIPVLTDCGHSFCLPCIKEVYNNNPSQCSKCRKELDRNSKFPINFPLLNIIEECNSKKNLSQDIICSIQILKEKLTTLIAIFDRKNSDISENRKIIQNDLKTLESLESLGSMEGVRTHGDSGLGDTKEALNEVKNRYLEISQNYIFFEDADRYSSFSLKKSKSCDDLLFNLYKTLKNSERIFAFKWIEKEPKFGELSVRDDTIIIHSLTLNEVPKGFKTVPFVDLKKAMKGKGLHTFIELPLKNGFSFSFLIKLEDSEAVPHFIKLSTGEYGVSYKNSSYSKGEDKGEFLEQGTSVVGYRIPHALWDNPDDNLICIPLRSNIRAKMITMVSILSVDNSKSLPADYSANFLIPRACIKNDIIVTDLPNERFQICRVLKPGNYSIIGKVLTLGNLQHINFDNPSTCKILDCGVVIKL